MKSNFHLALITLASVFALYFLIDHLRKNYPSVVSAESNLEKGKSLQKIKFSINSNVLLQYFADELKLNNFLRNHQNFNELRICFMKKLSPRVYNLKLFHRKKKVIYRKCAFIFKPLALSARKFVSPWVKSQF
jgi:hypothetical protein